MKEDDRHRGTTTSGAPQEFETVSDEELVGLVCDQDQELFREVVRRYHAPLLRYAGTLLRDEDRAKDAVQEAFIKAFVNLRGFDRSRKFSSWMYRIVRNESLDRIASDRRTVSLEDEALALAETLSDDGPLQDEQFDERVLRERVREGVQQLPLLYREPLALRYLEERSYDEIADVLRLPPGTVAIRIRRAKLLLASLLAQVREEQR